MKKKYGKKIICGILSASVLFALTGCQKLQMDYTQEEQDLYAEYAANLVLKHDKNYIDRMRYVEVTTQEETTQAAAVQPGDTVQNMENTQAAQTVSDLNQLFGNASISIAANGFEVLDAYPSTKDQPAMSMVAIKGHKLLVMKFRVTNISQADVTVDFLNSGASYRGVINGSVRMNVQLTALLDAFNTYQGVIAAGETKDLVLVFQVDEGDASNISSLGLDVTLGDKQASLAIN